MSGEIPDKEHNELKGVIDRLMERLVNSHPNMVMNEAVHLTYQTDYDAGDAIRLTASKMLDSDDEKLHYHVFQYFEWEAKNVPEASSAWLLIAKAAAEIDGGGRLGVGITELAAALDYIQRVVDKSDRPIDDEYLERLLEAFNLLNENSDLLAEEYQQAALSFSRDIFETSIIDDSNEASRRHNSINQLLVHVSRAADAQYPATARMARGHIKGQEYIDAVESERFSKKLWLAIEVSDFDQARNLLQQSEYDIDESVWRKIEDIYGFGQYDQGWINAFIEIVNEEKPDYFEALSHNSSRGLMYTMRVGYVIGLAARHDIVDRIFSSTPVDPEMDIAVAVDLAKAYGQREDYAGIDKLIKMENFDLETKRTLTDVFTVGTDTPHPTAGQY